MSDNTYWICFWSLAAVMFLIGFALIFVYNRYHDELYYKAQSECVNTGGSWIPTRSIPMCLRK